MADAGDAEEGTWTPPTSTTGLLDPVLFAPDSMRGSPPPPRPAALSGSTLGLSVDMWPRTGGVPCASVSPPRTPKRQLKVVPDVSAAFAAHDDAKLTCCIMTANLGSAGEDTTHEVLHHFVRDVRAVLTQHRVHIFCLHLQEIGGKSFNEAFVRQLKMEIPTFFPNAGWQSGLMWHGTNDADFTAVGAIILIHPAAVDRVRMLDFTTNEYTPVHDIALPLTAGRHFECRKFQDAGTSRKGWVRYGLQFNGHEMLLIALHLYHDADNRVSLSESVRGTGPYAERRSGALREVLRDYREMERAHRNFMIGGDFNFRMDAQALVDWVQSRKRSASPTVTKREISWGADEREVSDMFGRHWQEFRSICHEAEVNQRRLNEELHVDLHELPVCWPPTYPMKPLFESSVKRSDTAHDWVDEEYSQKRLPAWTDRIMFTPSDSYADMSYHCMSSPLDHKLVFLLWHSGEGGS